MRYTGFHFRYLISVILFSSTLFFAQEIQVLTFSEIMFHPSASNSEFIEIFNKSDTAEVDLSNFKIGYHTSKIEMIYTVSDSAILQPGHYAVIFENDYDMQTGIYQNISENTLVMKIGDNAFGSSGMSNSSDRTVYLLNADEDTVDTYTYSANNSAGISDEKIDVHLQNFETNWLNSLLINGTPGKINSVTPKEYDLSILNVTISNDLLFENDSLWISTSIKNIGTETAENFLVTLYDDTNLDSTGQESELILSKEYSNLSPSDSTTAMVVIDSIQLRRYIIISKIDYSQDQDTTNNIYSINFDVFPEPKKFGDIVINEIMYRPAHNEPEWIEIFNNSGEAVNLKNWQVEDRSSKILITGGDNLIDPGGYLIIADDESITQFHNIPSPLITANLPSLNDSGDKLRLSDSLGFIIDSLEYFSSWGGSSHGKSLERISTTDNSIDSINWSSAISALRATPGRVNSVSLKKYDADIDSIFILPGQPVKDDNVEIIAILKNPGLEEINNINISIYNDVNMDSTASANELINSGVIPFISPHETANFTATLFNVRVKNYCLIADVEFDQDEYLENNSLQYKFTVREKPVDYNSLLINEIMYKPENDEPEWIEIYNNSADTIDLIEWHIADFKDTVRITDTTLLISPAGFIILSDDESINEYYEIPSSVLGISLPSLNNNWDHIKIVDPFYRIIDSVNYESSWGGYFEGRSLERKLYSYQGNDSTNWTSSISLSGATPGRANSAVPKEFDLIISNINIQSDYAILGSEVEITVKIKNVGLNQINSYRIDLFNDINSDSLSGPSELETTIYGASVYPADSSIHRITYENFEAGHNRLIAVITTDPGDYNENNIIYFSFNGIKLNEVRTDIVINEIMYSPVSPEPEWIELYNNSHKTIELNGYQIGDDSDTNRVIFESFLFTPETYAVVAGDSSILHIHPSITNLFIQKLPVLNNSNDKILILDSLDRIIDSLKYKSSWGGKSGTSLERISPDVIATDSSNWGTSFYSGTPGEKNSLSRKEFDIEVCYIRFSPPAPVAGDTVLIAALCKNRGTNEISFIINLSQGNNADPTSFTFIEASPQQKLSPDDSTLFTFNYKINNITGPSRFKAGAFAVEDELENNNSIIDIVSPRHPEKSIIINEIMYAPLNGEPEWIELYINSDNPVSMWHWTISDVLTTPQSQCITEDSFPIQPEEFIVLSKDSSIYNYHMDIPSRVIIIPFANLNNNSDGIVIRDSHGGTIDSVLFTTDWSVRSGFSLERISARSMSSDSAGWAASTDIEQSTPGRINSITPKDYDLTISYLKTVPDSPLLMDDVQLQAIIKNIGLNTAENFKVKFFIDDQTQFLIDDVLYGALDPDDSVTIQSTKSFALDKPVSVIVNIEFESDLNPLNNSDTLFIEPGYNQHTIIINEFMSNPNSAESEWIEFFNISERSINIRNWTVSDVSPGISKKVIVDYDFLIPPLDYFAVARDTANFPFVNTASLFEVPFGSLGNSEDGIIIFDMNGNMIDSIFYTRNWPALKGHSLERKNLNLSGNDSTNWLPSLEISGGSPGAVNSINNIVEYSYNQAVINEIMFAPSASSSEFIELFNISGEAIDLGGWTFHEEGGESYRISNRMLLQPDSYFVFAADSSILYNYDYADDREYISILNKSDLGLSNAGEKIFISDAFGNIIDSLTYSDSWHNRNITVVTDRSLERINPFISSENWNNWSSSVAEKGATPGLENSIFTIKSAGSSTIEIEPNPFSPDNDGFEDFAIISYKLKSATSQIRVKIFDDQGRQVRTLSNNMASGSSGDILFDGLDDSGRPLRIGMYIVFLEAIESGSGEVEAMKKVVVVARML